MSRQIATILYTPHHSTAPLIPRKTVLPLPVFYFGGGLGKMRISHSRHTCFVLAYSQSLGHLGVSHRVQLFRGQQQSTGTPLPIPVVVPGVRCFGECGDVLDAPLPERRASEGRQRVASKSQLDHSSRGVGSINQGRRWGSTKAVGGQEKTRQGRVRQGLRQGRAIKVVHGKARQRSS